MTSIRGYFEEKVTFTQTGQKLCTRYYPHSMSAYGLANALYYHNKSRRRDMLRRKDIYADNLAARYDKFFDEEFNRKDMQDKQPSEDERKQHELKFRAAKSVFGANIKNISQSVIEQMYADEAIVEKARDYESRELNKANFNSRMQRRISWLLGSEMFERLVEEYLFVKETKDFKELVKRYNPVLSQFASRSVSFADREDLYQEGLLTMWACAQKYEGRRFASFSTMLRTSLRNKFRDMMRFSRADKRRINYMARSIGIGNPGDTYAAKELDGLAVSSWRLMKADDDIDGYGPSVGFLFHNFGYNGIYGKEIVPVFRRSREEVDANNFPHLNEDAIQFDTLETEETIAARYERLKDAKCDWF